MNDVTIGRWVLLIPAAPLLISLSALISAYSLPTTEDWAVVVLTAVAPLTPLVGGGVLACLFLDWRKGKVELRQPRVLAGVALSLLDIVLPVGGVIYVLIGLSSGGRLSF